MPIKLLLFALAALVVATGTTCAADATVDIEMTVRLDPSARIVEGTARLRLPAGNSRRLLLASAARLRTLAINDQPARRRERVQGELRSWSLPSRAETVDVRWEQSLEPTPTNLDHRATIGRPKWPVAPGQGLSTDGLKRTSGTSGRRSKSTAAWSRRSSA